jgi:hypothetical protein
MKQYKYTSSFSSPIRFCALGDESFISKASLENLKPLIPQDIDFSENLDLLGVAFNAAVVNKFNKNDDGMDAVTASQVVKNFIHKPTNIEHDKSQIVGHIVSAGFSEYGQDSALISLDTVASRTDAFNISLGAVVYKYANKDFASMIQRSVDPTDTMYQHISTSWEIGFNDFTIAVGGEDFADCELITNPKHFEEMKAKLKAYGGPGRLSDGSKVYRILKGEVFPLGVGFTTNPAADVKGLFSDQSEFNAFPVQEKKSIFNMKHPLFNEKNKSKISQDKILAVNNTKIKTMEVEKILLELKDVLLEKKFSEEAVANMTNTFADAIKQKDAEYKASLVAASKEKEALAAEREALKASMAEIREQLEVSSQKLAEFEAFKKIEEGLARFNSRMDTVDQSYELDAEDRQFLVQELKSLDETEESFASFQSKLAVVWKHKNKEAKASIDKSIQDKIDAEVEKKIAKFKLSKASEEKEAEKEPEDSDSIPDAIENAEASEAGISSSNETSSRSEPSLRDKFAAAFNRNNIIIS